MSNVKKHTSKSQSAKKTTSPQESKTILANKAESENVNKKTYQFEVFDNFLGSEMVDDVKKTMNKCVNSASCTIDNVAMVSTANNNLMQEILNDFSSSASQVFAKNVSTSQDFLSCKDTNDWFSLQQKLFEINYSAAMDFYLKLGYNIQHFLSKSLDISNNCMEKNIKCFTDKY